MSETIVGIDLGTTNTCVAVYRDNELKILFNKEGGRTTPSYIFVTDKDAIIVGKHAQKMAEAKPEYGISEIKRLIGRKYDDPSVQNNMKYFPYTLTSSDNNEPLVTITRKNEKFTKNPVKLCSAILRKVKKDAEDKLETTIDKAVITVPAYFNVSQREATLEAAKRAGLAVLKLMNEPTSAALTYYLHHDQEDNYILVYDLGGGTFDVAVVKRNGNNIDIIGVDGDTHLGGHDFDNVIVDYVCDYLLKNHNYNPKGDHRAMKRLQRECIEAKETLSSSDETTLVFNGFVKDCPTIEIELTREKLEEMMHNLIETTINIVDNCLKSCKLTKSDIKEIILCGGSTRIPKIETMVSSFFNRKNLNKVINPDECVAEGAALQAAMFSSNPSQKITAFQIRDVTPLSLGTERAFNLMDIIIKRNTPIPLTQTVTYVNVYNLQKSMSFTIYEGERMDVKENRHLGVFEIDNITPAPPGKCEVSFAMSIDENGILKVQAKEILRDNVRELTVNYTRGCRSDNEVKNALKDAADHQEEDERFVKFANLKEYVLDYCISINYNLEKNTLDTSYPELRNLCTTTQLKVEMLDLDDEDKLKEIHKELEKKCEYVVMKYNFEIMPILEQ